MVHMTTNAPGDARAYPGPDRRRFARQAPPFLRAEVAGHSGTARVGDLSRGGFNLTLPERLTPGSLMTIRLFPSSGGEALERQARVMYVMGQTGSFTVGGAFRPELSEEELQSLV